MGDQLDVFDHHKNAELRMEQHFKLGSQQQEQLLETIGRTVIIDKLVPPAQMEFFPLTHTVPRIHLRYSNDNRARGIHRHALTQLCQKVQLPMSYVNLLQTGQEGWKFDLLAENLNKLFQQPQWEEKNGASIRFLHRTVDMELRGFLSRRYNRHLASAPLLRSFVDACAFVGAKPVEAASSPVRNALKCLLPTVFEVFPGEYICLGVTFSNSDFGVGRLAVHQTVWRIKTGSAAILDTGVSRTHVGSVMEESDLELSEDTAHKEVVAQQGVIRDSVNAFLSQSAVEGLVEALRYAHEKQIPWTTLRARLRDLVGKKELEAMQDALDTGGAGILDLPPISFTPDRERVPNLYWASSYLGILAAKNEDPDRRLELQQEAGKLLGHA